MNGKPVRIAFRADGGPHIGMGHIMRCIVLAKELSKRGAETIFITRSDLHVSKIIEESNLKQAIIGDLKPDEEINYVKEILKKYDINIAVTDSYNIGQSYLEQIRDCVAMLVSIDDLSETVFPSDIVINGNIYAPALHYRTVRDDTDFLLGTSYTLLREEFLTIKKKEIGDKVKNVLVTVGGADPLNLTPKILSALNEADIDVNIQVVMGPVFNNLPDIEKTARKVNKQVELLSDVTNMALLMSACDIAITAGGSTLYELACTGTPALVLLQAKNQELAAQEMHNRGCIINLGMGDRVSVTKMSKFIRTLCFDRRLRVEMSKIGRSLVDGFGAKRCAEKILCKFINE